MLKYEKQYNHKMSKIQNIKQIKKYQPFIKWAGGKRGLLSQILEKLPSDFENYHEPFLGGGALFFELYSRGLLDGKKVFLSDINEELINTYMVVKKAPLKLLEILNDYKDKHSKEFYYKIREQDRDKDFKKSSSIKRAARFIYLNKTCFNGLYRVNKKGYFNVPIGSYKNPNIADFETIMSASEALQNAEILNISFNQIRDYVKRHDLVYFDPPYYPLNNTQSFTSYNENEFLDDKQRELFELFEALHVEGCIVLHSNSDTDFIKSLYQNYRIDFLQANRFINSKSSARGKINEVLVRSI